MNKLKLFSPVVLRIGLALIFLWFGSSQIIDTKAWIGFVPDWAASLSHISTATLVHVNGIFEIIFGAALLLGFYTRITAFLLALHMLDITFTVGYNSIGIRDFGLSIATIAVWMQGADFLTLDRFIKGKPNTEHPLP